jgi:hypothetical protein
VILNNISTNREARHRPRIEISHAGSFYFQYDKLIYLHLANVG